MILVPSDGTVPSIFKGTQKTRCHALIPNYCSSGVNFSSSLKNLEVQEKSEKKNILKLYKFTEKETNCIGIPGIVLKKGEEISSYFVTEVIYAIREVFVPHI